MIGENLQVPDYVEKITCYRTWELKENQLYPYYKRDEPWNPNKNVAECKGLYQKHQAPNKACSCGLYGFHDLKSALNINYGIIGVTEHWGKSEVHQDGLRSQYAQIKALCSVTNKKDQLSKIMISFFPESRTFQIINGIAITLILITSFITAITINQTIMPFKSIENSFSQIILYIYMFIVLTVISVCICAFITLTLSTLFSKKKRKLLLQKRNLKKYCNQHQIPFAKNIGQLSEYHSNRINL